MSVTTACAVLLCLVAGSLQLSIKYFVVPKAVEIGDDAELRCQYELNEGESDGALYVKWWWKPEAPSSDYRKLIYQRIAGQAAESIHHDNASKIDIKENDTIVLRDVSPADSGTYECEVNNIDEIRKHESLTVFSMGTGPQINYTTIESELQDEEDSLLIECEAEDVAPLPDVTLTLQGEKMKTNKIVEDSDKDGLYRIYANASVSAENLVESEIRCEVFYTTLEHPSYVDVETYTPPVRDVPPTTEPPEDTTQQDATPNSLPNSSDDGFRTTGSWILLMLATILTHLQSKL